MEEAAYLGNARTTIILLGWCPVAISFFALMPPRRAVILGFMLAWLFLPIADVKIASGIPLYDKMVATTLGVFVGSLLFDANRWLRFRPGWFDLIPVVYFMAPVISSLTNGLGVYDAMSCLTAGLLRVGLPLLIARLYFSELEGLKDLAVAMFFGGLAYVPLCWFELRMSPQLHATVYGYFQHSFEQTVRFGGWRPTVFMEHGLTVAMWMTAASLAGLWLWRQGIIRRFWGVPMFCWVGLLYLTTIMLKSGNSWCALILGTGMFFLLRKKPSPLPFYLFACGVLLFLFVRAMGLWSGDILVDAARQTLGNERADSLQTRFDNEDILSAHARGRIVFGWAGWGRSRPADEQTIPDSTWIIMFGTRGAFGLMIWVTLNLLPVLLLARRLPPVYWNHPMAAGAVCFAVVQSLFVLDCLFNSMGNPIFYLANGGLLGLCAVQQRQAVPVRPRPPRAPR